ncbi:N-6 DNA methylase [Leisingera caerulea]|uniref:N-6 DNA methylase n=1 Tax=Leisingera caerulea TaxID=506591 RepID=UPI0004016168|nr:N-6 DNA methylase [Leisingera caerulea]
MNKLSPIRTNKTVILEPVKEFTKLFRTTARYHHRHEVFRDFIFCAACALYNGVPPKAQDREQEYLDTINRYAADDRAAFQRLFALLVEALEPEPRDVLGSIFMSLELGDAWKGQFFTPSEVSRMMAEMLIGDLDEKLSRGDPVSVSEPACGAGGMVLAVADAILRRGYNPAKVMSAHAIDVDRTAALMTYIQLSLWNIPATVVVGNALTLEEREIWKTPALRNPVLRL